MARKTNDANLKRFERSTGRKARATVNRPQRQYFLIACEGEATEPNYFEAIKASFPPEVLDVREFRIRGTGFNTKSLLALAERHKQEWEHRLRRKLEKVWVVFDRDSFDPEDFNSTIEKCDPSRGIVPAWSNEAFELWYLLHFNKHTSALNRSQYKTKLEKSFKAAGLQNFKYRKNSKAMFQLLEQYGSFLAAFDRAQELLASYGERKDYANHNPCTTVHLMVQALKDIANAMIQRQ